MGGGGESVVTTERITVVTVSSAFLVKSYQWAEGDCSLDPWDHNPVQN